MQAVGAGRPAPGGGMSGMPKRSPAQRPAPAAARPPPRYFVVSFPALGMKPVFLLL